MRKILIAATLAFAGTLALSACNKQADEQQPAAQQQAAATRPTDPNDTQAWNAYLVQVLQNNLQGMTADRPYAYLVPAGTDEAAQAKYERQLEQVQDVVARGVLPGNLLAFAGPDSSRTADFVTAAFKDAKPGSFKGVIIEFIGDQADKDRVMAVLQPLGGEARFIQM